MENVKRYTTAPKDYDYSYAMRRRLVGTIVHGYSEPTNVFEVTLPADRAEYQSERYMSGMHPVSRSIEHFEAFNGWKPRNKTLDDVTRAVLDVFPDAELGEDSTGQIVVYTGCHVGIGNVIESMPGAESRTDTQSDISDYLDSALGRREQ